MDLKNVAYLFVFAMVTSACGKMESSFESIVSEDYLKSSRCKGLKCAGSSSTTPTPTATPQPTPTATPISTATPVPTPTSTATPAPTPIAGNTAPVADAGPDQVVLDTVIVSQDATTGAYKYAEINEQIVQLAASASDAQNNIVSYAWRLNGQLVVQNNLASTLTTSMNLIPGSHLLTLEVTDAGGLKASDTVTIIVKPYIKKGEGKVLAVYAGSQHVIEDKDNTGVEIVRMKGAVNSLNPIVSYKWTRVWPATTFATGTSANLLTTGFTLELGVHVLKLEVVDSLGNIATASTTITIMGKQSQPMPASFPIIPSNFNVSDYIVNISTPIIGNGLPDVVGAFRFICKPSHLLYDDPIVYPGKPGASHLHQFFGNTLANANSTYDSLRKTGDGTCPGGPLNRSAYWAPAMLNGRGQVVIPDYLNVYYKAVPGEARLPRGLRMVFGYDMRYPAKGTPGYLKCLSGADTSSKKYLDELNCPAGAQFSLVLATQTCWDGKNLDSPDHRSHMADAFNNNTDGRRRCPSTHPVLIPQFTMHIAYTQQGATDTRTWRLSSDMIMNADGSMTTLRGGSTIHADWFGAWDESIMDEWMLNCLDALKSGADGNLCNGRMLKRPPNFSFTTVPNLAPIPVNANGMTAH